MKTQTKQAIGITILGLIAIIALIIVATIAIKIGIAILGFVFSPLGLSAIGGALAMFAVIYYIAMKR